MAKISPERRSLLMAAVKGRNTKPELAVRRFLHRNGLRYSLHPRDLPGTPDIVFRSRKVAVFVHGCFWHRCPNCRVGLQRVRANQEYWAPKFERTLQRDAAAIEALKARGWAAMTIWECETIDDKKLQGIAKMILKRKQADSKTRHPRGRLFD